MNPSTTGGRVHDYCCMFTCLLLAVHSVLLVCSWGLVVAQVQYCFTAEGQPDSRNPSSLLGLDGDLYYRCVLWKYLLNSYKQL